MRMAEFVAINDMGNEKYVRSVCPLNSEVIDDKGGVFIESASSCFQVDCTYAEALAELNAALVECAPIQDKLISTDLQTYRAQLIVDAHQADLDAITVDRDKWMNQAAQKDQIISTLRETCAKHETKLKYYQSYMQGLYETESERDSLRACCGKLSRENNSLTQHLKKFDKVKRAKNKYRRMLRELADQFAKICDAV